MPEEIHFPADLCLDEFQMELLALILNTFRKRPECAPMRGCWIQGTRTLDPELGIVKTVHCCGLGAGWYDENPEYDSVPDLLLKDGSISLMQSIKPDSPITGNWLRGFIAGWDSYTIGSPPSHMSADWDKGYRAGRWTHQTCQTICKEVPRQKKIVGGPR